jgi:hypothetical protein
MIKAHSPIVIKKHGTFTLGRQLIDDTGVCNLPTPGSARLYLEKRGPRDVRSIYWTTRREFMTERGFAASFTAPVRGDFS